MITYNDIYEIARKERYSDQLQPLINNFSLEVANYLKEKQEIASKDDDVFSDVALKTKKQLENAMTLFKELMLRRRKKILNLVLIATETGVSKQDLDNMLSFEKSLFEDLMKCLENSEKKFNEEFNGKSEDGKKNELIIFKDNVEEFLDLNGQKMGPFEKGDVANIPREIANIFLDDGKAETMDK